MSLDPKATTGRPHWRWRTATVAGAAVLLAALAAWGGTWWFRRPPPPPVPPEVDLTGVEPLVAVQVREAVAAARAAPDSGIAWGRLGMILSICRYDAESATCYRQAERCNRAEARWPYLLGLALLGTDPAEALPHFRRSADLCGGRPDAPQLRLAQTLLLLGQLDEAEQEFRRLLEAHPDHAHAHLGLGRTLFARGHPVEALAALGPAADSPLTQKAAAIFAAQIRRELADLDGADRELARAAALPEDPPVPDPFLEEVSSLDRTRNGYLTRIAMLRRQGRLPEAELLTQESWRDYPDLGWMNEAKRYLGAGQFDEAENAARRAVEVAGESFQARLILGEVLFVRQDYSGAATSFREATCLDPGNGSARHALAHCLLALGKLDEAVEAFHTAARYLPESAKAQRDLGDALARAGRIDEALIHLRQAVRLDPKDEEARRRLEEVEKQAASPGG